jgi:drug/metabolite transporter (DMT)-like permease
VRVRILSASRALHTFAQPHDCTSNTMPKAVPWTATVFVLLAFAANSVLCRLAISQTHIDATSFASIRIISGAIFLFVLASRFRVSTYRWQNGSWLSSLALFGYVVGFSFAYVHLAAGTGALLLFVAVQFTMIAYGCWLGEPISKSTVFGFLLAFCGLIGIVLPDLSTPSLGSALLMLGAGASWGAYSLLGRVASDAVAATAGNFVRASLLAALLGAVCAPWAKVDLAGLSYAVISGALASGAGYIVWYAVLRQMSAVTAATVQLSVPVITALIGIGLLNEQLTARFVIASMAILTGITIVISHQNSRKLPARSPRPSALHG